MKKIPPSCQEETLSQPLCYNENIRSLEGKFWGEVNQSLFQKWSHLGYSRVRHIWDQELNAFRSIDDLCRLTRSPELTGIGNEVLESIPSELTPVQIDDWLTLDTQDLSRSQEFYQVHEDLPFSFRVTKYKKMAGSERLIPISNDQEIIPHLNTTAARIVFKTLQGKVESFNSKTPPTDTLTPWSFRSDIVKNLDIDPKEWVWKRKGSLEEERFFGYTTKRGYRIITDRQAKQSKFDVTLSNLGYTGIQRKQFYQELWHPWVPRKVGTMIWLTCNEGLPLAE